MNKTKISVVGREFGSLTCISERFYERREKYNACFVICRCQCGNVKRYRWSNLVSGRSTRCVGCQTKKRMIYGYPVKDSNRYHYWQRNRKRFCKEWQSFPVFEKWRNEFVGNKPIYLRPLDPNKLIGPNNYRLDKSNTYIKSRLIEYLCHRSAEEWSRLLCVSRQRVYQLIKMWGSMEEALNQRGQSHLIPESYRESSK